MFTYHPYQSIFFNSLVSEKTKNNFDKDYMGLGGVDALRKIISLDKKITIKVATGSFLPLERSLDLLEPNEKKRIKLVGSAYEEADYIYTNFISEVDNNLNKKYKIPNNFINFFDKKVNKVKIYQVYKKK